MLKAVQEFIYGVKSIITLIVGVIVIIVEFWVAKE